MTDIKFPSFEYELLTGLSKVLGAHASPDDTYHVTIGDDAAIRSSAVKGEKTIYTTDIAVENIHFKQSFMSFKEIGFKVMAANVSDCAAMGARPEAALVNLVFPQAGTGLVEKDSLALYEGFAEACKKWQFKIIGGDLAAGPCWTIGITMIGKAQPDSRLLTRKGIISGDKLWATSLPGMSAAGLEALEKWGRRDVPSQFERLVACHVRPDPDPEQGVLLAGCPEVHAMMDLSDGISKDGRTLCFDNKLGLVLDVYALFPPADMASLAKILGRECSDWFMHGGEEYSLLFAADPGFDPVQKFGDEKFTALGTFTSAHDKIIARVAEDSIVEVERSGWDHLRGT